MRTKNKELAPVNQSGNFTANEASNCIFLQLNIAYVDDITKLLATLAELKAFCSPDKNLRIQVNAHNDKVDPSIDEID